MRFEFRCPRCRKIWWTDTNGIFKCSCGSDMKVAEVASTTLFYSDNAAWRKTIGKYLKKRAGQANMKKLLILFCLLVFGILPVNAQTPSLKDLLLDNLASTQIITFGELHEGKQRRRGARK